MKSVGDQNGRDFNWLPPAREGNRKAHAAGRLYLTTSGSTGEPKAMVFSIDTLWRSAKAFLAAHPTASNDSRFYNFLPMSYLGGLFNLGLIPIASKGSVVVAESFSGRSFLDFWQNVERFEVNVLWLVPTIARGLLTLAERTGRHQLASINGAVKFGFIGTAPIDLETKNRFESTFGIPILENFALSETTFISSETLTNKDSRVAGSVGQRLPYVDIDFRPIAKADEDSEDFKSSEILVRTPFFFLGYLKHDGSIESPLDANGFMATGDVGHLDDEGRLIIEGRYRDIIKKGGYFIALLEIENLAKTNPSVEEVAAVKVSHNFYGEDSVLLVRFKPNSTINIDQFGQWLRQNLVKYKWPERILAVDEFPRTQSGKIRKHLIKI
ncbi:MAG: long-chain fatty acid--CoA ligase [Xanthobacteraceae bacterium]|nr:long-chain fatty acid--CoA ligase [Xanthobacteraceae bacterium]